MTAIGMAIWAYLCICAALDGFGTAPWHWSLVICTGAAVVLALAREELRGRRIARRAQESRSRNAPRVIGESVAWRGRDPWANR